VWSREQTYQNPNAKDFYIENYKVWKREIVENTGRSILWYWISGINIVKKTIVSNSNKFW
jgi:hypothetical protein